MNRTSRAWLAAGLSRGREDRVPQVGNWTVSLCWYGGSGQDAISRIGIVPTRMDGAFRVVENPREPNRPAWTETRASGRTVLVVRQVRRLHRVDPLHHLARPMGQTQQESAPHPRLDNLIRSIERIRMSKTFG